MSANGIKILEQMQLSDDAKKVLLYGCAALGAYKLAQATSDVMYGTWKHFVRPRKNLRTRYSLPNQEPWVVVSGGASGLGLAYATELAQEGFRILIVDKNARALEAACTSLKSAGCKECLTIHYDFDEVSTIEGHDDLIAALDEALQGKDVAILINNVAEFQSQALADASWEYVLRATNVNAHSYAAMLRYFVPKMLQRLEIFGKKGAIMTIGTCAAEPQNPRFQFSIYGASKAYGHIMSSSMQEMHGDKLDVMTVIPRQCSTDMNTAGFMFTVSPKTHAKAVIDQLGHESVTYGPFTHCLEYNMRFKYQLLGIFDSYVQFCNRSRNIKLIKDYEKFGNKKTAARTAG